MRIRVFVDKTGNANWQLAVEAVDNGKMGGSPILTAGFAGIRGDFMDLEFDNYVASDLLAE